MPGLRVSGHERDREAVVPLAADGLNRRRGHARLGREQLGEAAYSLNDAGRFVSAQSCIAFTCRYSSIRPKKRPDSAPWLADRLGMPHAYLVPFVDWAPDHAFTCGLAILSRHAILRQEQLDAWRRR